MSTDLYFNFHDFDILNKGTVSKTFIAHGIGTFQDACRYVKFMPYQRNEDKLNPLCVLQDGYGTCSTKHAILKILAMENEAGHVQLKLGIFRMGRSYSRKITGTLVANGLEYIPEAHMYLVVNGELVDCTNGSSGKEDFVSELIEINIRPEQLTDFKVNYHKQFLQIWLNENKHIKYSLSELFAIREQCIADLCGN